MTKTFYTEDHDWIEIIEDNKVRIGITEYAQDQLGDIVYVELPEVGDDLEAGDELGTVESVKSVSEILSPLTGTITAVNEALEDEPELVNDDAIGEGWFVELETDGDVDTTGLLSKEEYDALIEE
ncbi:MAG TPA: glycine cleavage system protein GcvH [Atopostipes sp.]|nr:glycine cleavage system protein GcvH [Atopostipes sp.]